VHRKLPLVLTLAAWLFATGSQWDLVQAFAWARMLATNVETMSVTDALAQTFSPEGRCTLCEAVSAAKEQQDENGQAAVGRLPGKTVLVYLPAAPVVIAKPDSVSFLPGEFTNHGVERPAPLLTPPRV
jgi:hypothetical protein